jgi:hypothetical protein
MKKSIFIAVLGVAASVATSYGQNGFIAFNSYSANHALGAITTLADGTTPVTSVFTADLYYFLGTISDPVGGSPTSPVTGLTEVPGVTVAYDSNGDGYFQGPTATIPGYTSGPVNFEVVAFNGSSYANSAMRGRSGSFTESAIASSASSPLTFFGANGSGMPNFIVASVAPVPEPTTLALAGLGGLASLVALRRKKA